MSGYHDLVLTGLLGSRPIGALAAFGLLRLCGRIPELRDATLRWSMRDDWTAVLGLPQALDPEALVVRLVEHHAATAWPHLDWSPDGGLRVPREVFAQQLVEALVSADVAERERCDFLAALGSDAIADDKGRLTPTRMHMTSGQQTFLGGLIGVAESLVPDGKPRGRRTPAAIQAAFQEALFGPWTYPDLEHSLGWDADAERMHALRAIAPTSDTTNKSVRAAIWLAHHALPLLPTVPVGQRLKTTAFREVRRQRPCLRWPLWQTPLGLDSVRSLLASAALVGDGDRLTELHARGVAVVFESLRHEFGQGYGIFRPAVPVMG